MDQLEPQVEGAGGGKIAEVSGFLTATRREMEKVSWPTREELQQATQRVVISALALGVVIGLFDLLLNRIFIGFVASLGQ